MHKVHNPENLNPEVTSETIIFVEKILETTVKQLSKISETLSNDMAEPGNEDQVSKTPIEQTRMIIGRVIPMLERINSDQADSTYCNDLVKELILLGRHLIVVEVRHYMSRHDVRRYSKLPTNSPYRGHLEAIATAITVLKKHLPESEEDVNFKNNSSTAKIRY
jgi:hypothetical protein